MILLNKNISIIGAGGQCRALIPLLVDNKYQIEGIYDNNFNSQINETILDIRVKGKLDEVPTENTIILAIGDNGLRAEYFNYYYDRILKENLIHTSVVSVGNAILGRSNFISPRVIISCEVQIGMNNIINTGAIIEHETIVGNNNHISVGSIICGRVQIGNNCFIGAGAVVSDKVSICDNVIIGANSTVVKDITQPGTYVGCPTKKIE